MIKSGPTPQPSAANYNIFQVINFQTLQWLPHWEPWLPNPIFMKNQNRPTNYIAWHSRYPTVHPHSHQYSLLRSLTSNNLSQLTSLLKKYQRIDPNIINKPLDSKYSFNALQFAAISNNYPAIELLLLYGANINKPDKQGNTPLMLAVKNQSLQSINTLLKAGCDWSIANNYRIKPEEKAKQIKKQFIAHFIQQFAGNQKSPHRKFPRFKVKLDIQDQIESPFRKFANTYRKYSFKQLENNSHKIKINPFNNFSGEYRIDLCIYQ